jgi:hypothetical protein
MLAVKGFYLERSSLVCLIKHLLYSCNPVITGLPLYLFACLLINLQNPGNALSTSPFRAFTGTCFYHSALLK